MYHSNVTFLHQGRVGEGLEEFSVPSLQLFGESQFPPQMRWGQEGLGQRGSQARAPPLSHEPCGSLPGGPVLVPGWVHSGHLFLIPRLPGGLSGKESACSAGDPGSIPGSESSPGEGNGSLGNPTDRGTWRARVHRVTKGRTEQGTVFFTCVSTTGRRVLLTLMIVL